LKLTFSYPTIILRGAGIGVIIGTIPGVGSSISNLISYAETRRNAPDMESFGKGNPKGVIAAEAANSAAAFTPCAAVVFLPHCSISHCLQSGATPQARHLLLLYAIAIAS
jgi:TctA family transporter